MLTPELLHYFAVGIPVVCAGLGTGVGQGIAALGAIESLVRQQLGREQSFRAMIIGLALVESALVIALVVSILTLFGPQAVITWPIAFAELGMSIAIGFSSLFVGLSSSYAVRSACISITRQPFASQKVLTLMLLIQSLIEAALVFSFIVALFIRNGINPELDIYGGLKLLSAGLAIGIGCIGPLLGQAIFANKACLAVGFNSDAYKRVLPYSLLSEAAIETPLIFSLLVSLLILYFPLNPSNYFLSIVSFSIAAVTIGLGSFGAVASGRVSAKGCQEVALNSEIYASLLRSTLLAQAFIESTVIYALIVSLFLLIR
ncbi:MAG: ATP synthase F0 subunit C [bacterium]